MFRFKEKTHHCTFTTKEAPPPAPKEATVTPPPDESTKPKDIEGFCFAFACPRKHLFDEMKKISIEDFAQRKVCQKCGSLARLAIARRFAEAQWEDVNSFHSPSPRFAWRQYFPLVAGWGVRWTRYEFLRFLQPLKKGEK